MFWMSFDCGRMKLRDNLNVLNERSLLSFESLYDRRVRLRNEDGEHWKS